MTEYIEMHSVTLEHSTFLPPVDTLTEMVEQGRPEAELQSFIQRHPYVLSQQFAHCHHVFPRVKLGERFEADFLCLDIPSSGKEWIGVEIEPPEVRVVTRSGGEVPR